MQILGSYFYLMILFEHVHCVTIQLKHWYTNHTVITHSCTDIDPGTCCTPQPTFSGSANNIAGSEILVLGLRFQQLAFGYGRPPVSSLPPEDCTGAPLARIAGPKRVWRKFEPDRLDWQNFYVAAGFFPMNWHPAIPETWGPLAPSDANPDAPWHAAPDESILAASWVDLRTRFPPDSDARVRYLQWQGVKGLVWGKNVWSAASDGVIFPRGEKESLSKRVILPQNMTILTNALSVGTAYLTAPRRWQYAEIIAINETTKSDGK